MQVKNTSACILLFFAVWELILPVKSKQIKCEPGKTLEKIQNVFDCVPCPPGTFSKGNNSVCRPCKKCHKKRVKKKCTATHNTVCKGAHSCTSYWKKKKVNYLMKYCWFTRCKTQSGKCVAQKVRTPDISIQRTNTLSGTEPTTASSRREITSQDLGSVDEGSVRTTFVTVRTNHGPLDTSNTTVSVSPSYRSANTSTGDGTNLEETEDNLPQQGHITYIIVVTLVFATAMVLTTFILLIVKMNINKGKSRSNVAHKVSESDPKSGLETVVLLDTMQTKSRTTLLSESRFQDVSYNVDKTHAYAKRTMHVKNVKSSTNHCQQIYMVPPAHKIHVIQNDYSQFPAHGAVEDNHTNCSVNEACTKRSPISSVSSGCSDMSRHGQRVESDDDSLWYSDQSWTNEPEVVKIIDATSRHPDHESPTNSEVCQISAADVTEECQIQKSSLLLLDTVVPLCKEAVLKPKEATCVDLQKHVKSCDQNKLEPFWSHGEGGKSDVTTDHGQQGLNTAATSTVENDDGRWLEFLNSKKETNDDTTAVLSALRQINCSSPCSRDAIAKDNGADNCSQGKQAFAEDGSAGALGEPKHIENQATSLEMGSPDKTLNNWTYQPYFTETSFKHDREYESECVFGSNTENSTGNISDRNSSDMTASTSGSTSTASSSDELSSSSPSPSSTPEPVTYVTIHNKHEVKDSNKTANIHRETQVLAIDSAAVPDMAVPSAANVTEEPQNSEDITSDPERRIHTCSHTQGADSSQQCHQDHPSIQHDESERHPVSQDRFNTPIVNSKKTSYDKVKQCNPENLHETLHKTEGTQTHHNCENMQTIFGQKWDVKKYFSSKGGQLSKSTTNMSLTIFENSISEGETVLVGGRFTGNFLDVLPYLDEGWVVISPLAEFQMVYRKRWDKHVKIYIPYYPHNPKEILRVCFYHRTEKGDIQHGDVPPFDDSKNQDMYFVQKADHVEIYTVSFTLFHCACDHVFPLFLTSLVFTSYNKNENEALVRLHVGDKRLEDPLISKEIEDKERQQHGTMLNQSKPVRLLQCEEFAGDTRLVFKIDFPPKRGQGRTASDTASTSWENLFPENCPQIQERRFCELVKCMCQCKSEGKMATKCVSTRHDCREEIEWTFTSTADPCPDQFPCTIAITHELPVGQEADRHGACQEGVTWYRLKTPHRDPSTLEKLAPTHQEFALRELPSAWNNEDPYCGL